MWDAFTLGQHQRKGKLAVYNLRGGKYERIG